MKLTLNYTRWKENQTIYIDQYLLLTRLFSLVYLKCILKHDLFGLNDKKKKRKKKRRPVIDKGGYLLKYSSHFNAITRA